MAKPDDEVVTSWTGADDVAKARAQQRPAPPLHATRERPVEREAYLTSILDLLAAAPSRWWRYAEIGLATDRYETTVRDAMRVLIPRGAVEVRILGKRHIVRHFPGYARKHDDE